MAAVRLVQPVSAVPLRSTCASAGAMPPSTKVSTVKETVSRAVGVAAGTLHAHPQG